MVKFSHGCWHPSPDTLIDWAVEVVKAEARDDHLHFVTVSNPLPVLSWSSSYREASRVGPPGCDEEACKKQAYATV